MAGAPLALEQRPPFVEDQVRIAQAAGVIADFGLADRPEKGLQQVQAVDPQVLKRVRAVAKLGRLPGAAGIRRVIRAAKEIGARDLSANPGAQLLERLEDDRIHARRVIHGKRHAFLAGLGDHPVAIGGGLRHGLLDENVAAHFHGFERQLRVGCRRRQHMNNLRGRVFHGLQGGKYGRNLKLLRQCLGAILIEVGDPDNLYEGQAAQSASVIGADVSGPYQANLDLWGILHLGLSKTRLSPCRSNSKDTIITS